MKNIMLDLETLGNKPGAVIVAIGAVRFGGGALGEEFYQLVDAQSCVDCGLKLDVNTVLWWMKQNDSARAELTKTDDLRLKLPDALGEFSSFIGCDLNDQRATDAIIWGNGADFDNAILAAAYETCRIDLVLPWKFYNNRCYRTMKAMRPEIKIENTGTKHNALDDAKAQAVHLMKLFPEI